ncbi:MAG: hypothetical protein L3J14_01560 [Flavobacteriaceae bacterium]|nr:hypothetical protein [Flavobacteriaceae bacterium]
MNLNSLKNKKILLIVFSFILIGCSKSETPIKPTPQLDFVKNFGGTKNERAQSVIKTNDGGYAVLGFTQSIDGDITDKTVENFDYWLLKFDSNDILQWSKTYGGSNDERAFKIIQTNDGGYAFVGYSNSNNEDVSTNAGLDDIWIVKTDASGTIIWEKSHGFSGNDQGFSIIQTTDNKYLITGVLDVTASGGNGNDRSAQHAGGDYWTLKLDTNGDKIWRRYFGGTLTDSSYDVVSTNDNGFILIGSSDSNDVDITNNKGTYDFWIVKIDTDGNQVWQKSFGGSQIDEAKSIVKTTDGNYLIVGDSRSSDVDVTNSKGAADIWLIKISDEGNLIWKKSYGGSSFDAARHISSTLDGGYIIAGSSRSQDIDVNINQGQNDAWILKIDNAGNIEWQKSFGGTEIDFAYSTVELNNQSIIVVGESNSSNGDVLENKGFSDLLIAKIKLQ